MLKILYNFKMLSFLSKTALLYLVILIVIILIMVTLEKFTRVSTKILFGWFFLGIGVFDVIIYLLWATRILKRIPGYLFFWFEPMMEQSGIKAIFFHLLRYAILPIIMGLSILSGRI
ncbi:hypothetical protein HYU95_02735 [Candidatus Daviesbacteria bacterium]|nr:hypothetical protein [Candidatus Daviesbacteria bacterium]